MQVSVLVLTFNEQENLPHLLSSLTWCDDVVVIDSGSTDNTVQVAKEFGARVHVRKFDTFAAQRN
jgi:glycosyltransferase involved in cell wall biosynthesis